MNIELSQACSICNQSNLERTAIKSSSKNRVTCEGCGAYVLKKKSKRVAINKSTEATFTPPIVTNPTTTIGPRVPKAVWKWRQYTPEESPMLGMSLIDWLRAHHQATSIKDWLLDANMSYLKLQRMAGDCPELAEALDLANMIIADRFKEQWEASEHMDINKYAPKFYDLHCPRVAAQQDKKLKLEVSAGQGIPYHDPTYPNLITKDKDGT